MRFTARGSALVLAVASVAMLGALVFVGRWLTFWSDEWTFLFRRSDPEALLRGSDVHLHFFPVLIYQALFRTAGLGSYYPYLAVAWTFHLASAWLLFAVGARLVGWGFGLTAGLSLLFLGSGFEVLLQPGQMGYSLSLATGLLALLLLARPSAEGRPAGRRLGAAVALGVSVTSSALGLILVGLVVVWAGLRRDWPAVSSALPAALLYGAWFPIWSEATVERLGFTPSALARIPAFVVNGLGASVAAVAGVPPYRFPAIGLAVGLGALAAVLGLGGRVTALALAALAALVAEFVLVAWFRSGFGVEFTARSGYLYSAAALVWLVAAGLCASARPRLGAWLRPWVVVPGLVLAILGNLVQLAGAARGMRADRAGQVVYLRLLEGLRASPDLDPDALTGRPAPRHYFRAIDRFGVPRLHAGEPTPADLEERQRHRLDDALVKLVAPGIRPAPGGRIEGPPPEVTVAGGRAHPAGASCVRVTAGATRATAVWVPATPAIALAGTPEAIRQLRVGVLAPPDQPIRNLRDAADAPLRLPPLPPGLRWTLRVDVAPGGAVTICSASTGERA